MYYFLNILLYKTSCKDFAHLIGGYSEEEKSIEKTGLKKTGLKKTGGSPLNLNEFFAARNLVEAEVYFSSLHHLLVHKTVSTAVESKDVAELVSQLFFLAASKEHSSASFEEARKV